MKISLNWLRDYVSWDESPTDLADRLTLLGLNVEGIEEFKISFPNVVVAKVVERDKHPDADRLSVCRVDDGEMVHQVVCGAPNVCAGLTVLLARVGAVLPGNFKIKKSKIRGVESFGMICSAKELDLGQDTAGIMELGEDLIPGTPADDIFGYRDTVLDIEVTPNRPDWLCHVGVAREIAAMKGSKISLPDFWSGQKGTRGVFDFNVEVKDFEDCSRYIACGVRDLRVGPAPDFIQNRLRAIGERPINNIVDISNYVMFELGQPLHAFDRNKLTGSRLATRRAEKGQPITTLDGEKRILSAEDLIIADNSGPVAIAGVMGARNSEVDDSTTEIVIESAFFAPALVRASSRRLGLLSESSYRFERGADWEMVDMAARRAQYLLHRYADGAPVGERVDRQNPDRTAPGDIALRVSQTNRVLGTDIETTDAVSILQRLGMKVTPLGSASDRKSAAASLMAKIPAFRRDLKMEIDLIEEIARLYGLDRIHSNDTRRQGGSSGRTLSVKRMEKLRNYLASIGCFEVVTSSFFSRDDLDRLLIPEDDPRRQCLAVLNPQHGGEILLRTSMLPSLLKCIAGNINSGTGVPFRIFNVSKVFLPRHEEMDDPRHGEERLLPQEHTLLQVAIAGRLDEGMGGVPADLLEIKGLAVQITSMLGLNLSLVPEDVQPYLTAGRQMRIVGENDRASGYIGSIHRRTLEACGVDHRVAILELDLSCFEARAEEIHFRSFSRYPAVKRDLSLLLPDSVPSAVLENVVRENGGDFLESVELFDIYRSKELPKNFAAAGIRLKFRSDRGNLKSKTVEKTLVKMLSRLEEELGVTLRG